MRSADAVYKGVMSSPWGVILPLRELQSVGELVAAIEVAQQAGAQAVYLEEHPSSELDPFVTIAAVGVATKEIAVGALIQDLIGRPASIVAKLLTGADIALAGRACIGIGGLDSFGAVPVHREEAVNLITAMLENDQTTYEGATIHAPDAWNLPRHAPVASVMPRVARVMRSRELLRELSTNRSMESASIVEMSGCPPEEFHAIEELLYKHRARASRIGVFTVGDPHDSRTLSFVDHQLAFDAWLYRWREIPPMDLFSSILAGLVHLPQ